MTFTTRNGETTCDHCHGVVGRTWRQRAEHVCPTLLARLKRAACTSTEGTSS